MRVEGRERLVQAAINGGRARAEHAALPITADQQAAESSAAVAAGARAIHVHVRDADGRESVASGDVAAALEAIRSACPAIPVGISTGAWIVNDAVRRLALVRSWSVLPDYASVNVHEEGAGELMRLLIERGVGIEAGVWDARAARLLVGGGLAGECLRILLEPAGGAGDINANLEEMENVLAGIDRPALLHGAGRSTWPMIELSARRGYDTRVGLEDTLWLPDGSPAESNATLVAAALRIVAGIEKRATSRRPRPRSLRGR
jgi:uncharacterized protein (DUF849 family)